MLPTYRKILSTNSHWHHISRLLLKQGRVFCPSTFHVFKNDFKLTIPEWIVHTFIAEHVYITPAMWIRIWIFGISSDILLFQAIPRIKPWKNFPRKRVHDLFINIIHPKATINRFQSHANESYLLNILNDICLVHLIAVGNLSDYEYRDGISHNGITCLDRFRNHTKYQF